MRKLIGLCFCIGGILFLPIACNNAPQKPIAPEQSPKMTEEVSDRRIMTSRFSILAQEVDGVRNASVIITNQDPDGNVILLGNKNKKTQVELDDENYNSDDIITTASNDNIVVLVGLDVDDQAKKENINEIKEEIIDKIKAADKNVSEVLVTSNPETVNKIKNIASRIIQGESAESYDKEVKELAEEIRT